MNALLAQSVSQPLKSAATNYLVFTLEYGCYALPLEHVERVLPAAELTVLPAGPDVVLGVLNYRGRVLPALNTRQRFRLPDRDTQLSDVFILAHSQTRPVLLRADSVKGVEAHRDDDILPSETISPNLDHLSGVIRRPDGLVLIHDLDAFLSLDERQQLERVLTKAEEQP